MTIAQIMALLSLLMAFGVDTPTINKVAVILKQPAPIEQSLGSVIVDNLPKQKPLFTAPLKTACAGTIDLGLNTAQKDACMEYWLNKAPLAADGGTNMPQVWFDYYHATNK